MLNGSVIMPALPSLTTWQPSRRKLSAVGNQNTWISGSAASCTSVFRSYMLLNKHCWQPFNPPVSNLSHFLTTGNMYGAGDRQKEAKCLTWYSGSCLRLIDSLRSTSTHFRVFCDALYSLCPCLHGKYAKAACSHRNLPLYRYTYN